MTPRTAIAAASVAMAGLCVSARAQETGVKYDHFIGIRGDGGKVMQTNDFLKGDNENGVKMSSFGAGHVAFGWQTLGNKDWEVAHRLPSFGIGVGTLMMDNRSEIGTPASVFGFYNGVFARSSNGRHAFRYNIEMGVAAGWKCFDRITAPKNIAVGSKATVRIGLGLNYAYTIADRWTISLGGGFTHYSNGAMRKPNKGINLCSAQVSVEYALKERKLPAISKPAGKIKGNEIDFTVGYGTKRFEVDTVYYPGACSTPYQLGARYNSMTLQTQFLHQYCVKGKYGVGISVVYDELTGSGLRVKGRDDMEVVLGPANKRFSYGVFGAHEFCIGNLGIVTQMGYYLHQPKGIPHRQQKDKSFQRAGLKYTFPMGVHVGINIYAHRLTVADFIEWNLGYSLHLKKKKA